MSDQINNNSNNDNVFSDSDYIRKSTTLINESLQKGMDVAQLSNGDILITQIKTVSNRYRWDAEKGKMVRCKLINIGKLED